MSLLPPAPLNIRVVDVLGKPVGGLELGVSVHPEGSDWISASAINASHVRTDASGMATVPWAPRENLKYVDVDLLGSDWKVDETDLKQIKTRTITVHARREQEVQGRLIMPSGLECRGNTCQRALDLDRRISEPVRSPAPVGTGRLPYAFPQTMDLCWVSPIATGQATLGPA